MCVVGLNSEGMTRALHVFDKREIGLASAEAWELYHSILLPKELEASVAG